MAFKLPGIDFKANINATDIKVDFGAKNIANTPAHAFETKLTSINKALDPSALSQRGIQNLSHQLWNTTPNTLSGGINPDTNRGLSARLTNIKNTLADGLGLAFGRVKNAVSPTNTPTNTTGMRGLVNQFFEAPIDTIGLGFTQGFKALNIGKESLLASGQQAITHTKTAAMGLGNQLWAPFNFIGSAAANKTTELSQSISNKADAMNVRQEVAMPIENFFGAAINAIKAAPKNTVDFLKDLLPPSQGTATLKQADLVGSDSALAEAGSQSLVGRLASGGLDLFKQIFYAPFTLGSKLADAWSGTNQAANKLDQHRIPSAEEVRQIHISRPFDNA